MEKKKQPEPETPEYIDSLCGILGSKKNLSGELLKSRRQDDVIFMRKVNGFQSVKDATMRVDIALKELGKLHKRPSLKK